MSREEMLEYLQNITFWACGTTFTMDMGLEYDYANDEGYGSALGNMGDWPIHLIGPIEPAVLAYVKSKIRENALALDDLENTDLYDFAKALELGHPKEFEEQLSTYFMDLTKIPDNHNSDIFILSDLADWNVSVKFYVDEESLKEGFAEMCDCGAYENWEDLSDDDLADWVDRIKNNPIV